MDRSPYKWIALGILATVGLFEGSKGVLLPHMMTDLQLSPALGAAVMTAGGVGYLINSLTFGTVTQRFGLKRVVAFGGILALTMLTLFLTQRVPAVLYGANVLYGIGAGQVELSMSLPLSILYTPEEQASTLNLLHGFFGVGTLVGSVWGGYWMGVGAPWQLPLILVAALLAFWVWRYLRRPAVAVPRPEGKAGGYGPILSDPLVWVAALALGAAVAAEAGVALWLPTYLQKAKGLSEAVSAGYATAFFAGFTLTRLSGAWLVKRVGGIRLVVLLALVGLLAMVGLQAFPPAWAGLSVLLGAGCAVGFATCLSMVAGRYPDRVNRVYSIMYSSGGITGILVGPFMGWVAGRSGLGAAMWVPGAAFGVLAAAMGWYGYRSTR